MQLPMVQFHKRNKAQAINLVKQCYMHRDWFLLHIRTIAITYIPVYVIHAYISCMYHCNDLHKLIHLYVIHAYISVRKKN